MKSRSDDIWESYPGNKLSTLALPDYYSNYIAYTFDASQHPHTGLRITGYFPDARYMSVNIYATKQGTSLNALTDYQIMTPTPGGNPFVAGSRAAPGEQRQYVLHVQPEAGEKRGKKKQAPEPENLLTFDPGGLKDGELTVIIRYYVPQPDECGGVKLPTVEGYDVRDPAKPRLRPKPIPGRMLVHEPLFCKRMEPIFDAAGRRELRFYHVAGGGQFNNADNMYLISAVKGVDGRENVVVLKVRPPSYPTYSGEFDSATVRYWSFNQGDPDTSTPFGQRDAEFRAAKDGFVYVVMGDESFRDAAERGGYNYMPWRANRQQAVILYRNMLTVPQYRNSIARVPRLPPSGDWDKKVLVEYDASRYIGDSAPSGRKVTAAEFFESYGGMPSPGFP